MIPIYICDDEKPVADRLEHIISNQITISPFNMVI